MSQMGSEGVEDAVAGHARLLVTTAGTAMSAAARALAQRNRAAREREQAALAELRARAETDRRLMLLRLEMSRTASWRTESTLSEAATTLHLARLYASVEPTAAAAVPTLEEHIRTRWQREPDEVLAEQAYRAQQAREQAREAEAVWAAAREPQPVGASVDARTDPATAHLFVGQPGYETDPDPLQRAAGSWESILEDPDRWFGVDNYVFALEKALTFAEEHPGPARAAVIAEEKLRQLYPGVMAEYDALRQRSGAADALTEIAPQLRYVERDGKYRESYARMLAPDEGRGVDAATATAVWAATRFEYAIWDREWRLADHRAQERLRELAPAVMERFDQMMAPLGPKPRRPDSWWAVDKTVADLRAMVASERAQERAGSTSPVSEHSQERAKSAQDAGQARASSPGSSAERPAARESMHAHPAGAATEKTAGKDQSAGDLPEQLLQQRRRAAQRGVEREGHDRGGYDR